MLLIFTNGSLTLSKIGTFFIDQKLNSSSQITQLLSGICSPSALGAKALGTALQQILHLYPDIPALGAPFGTGNNTFGLSSQFKRASAICERRVSHSDR